MMKLKSIDIFSDSESAFKSLTQKKTTIIRTHKHIHACQEQAKQEKKMNKTKQITK